MFKIFFFETPQNMLESMFAFLLYTFIVLARTESSILLTALCGQFVYCDHKFEFEKPVVLRLFLIAYTPLGKYHELKKNHALIHVFPVLLPGNRFTKKP